jgi:hypothetical protein
VPTIVSWKQLGERDAIDSWIRGDHEHVGEYGSLEEAEAAARSRSDEIGRVRSRDRVKPSGAAIKDEEYGAQLLGLDLSEPSPVPGEAALSPTEQRYAEQPARAIATRRGGVQVQPADLTLQEPPQREADWLDVLKASPALMVTGGKGAYVGVRRIQEGDRAAELEHELQTGESPELRAARERAGAPSTAAITGRRPEQAIYSDRPADEERAAQIRPALAAATQRGEELKQWAAQIQKETELVTPADMTTAQQALVSLVQSAPPTLLGISAGIVTGNPAIAMILAGGGGAAFQAGSTYNEARDKGATHELAAAAARIDGILEGVGESIPLAAALKPGSPFVRRLLTVMGEEAGQEGITQLAQDFNAYLTYDPNITLAEAWQNFKIAVLAGGAGGAVYAGIGHLAERGAVKPGEAPLSGEPPAPTPEGDHGPFVPTHRLDGIQVAPQTEEGEPVAGVWRDAQGNVHEAQRAEPIQSPEPNAVWKVNGVDYDVEVTGKGRAADTARIADGQEVPIAELDLDDDAKVLLGLAEPEEPKDKSNKGEGAAESAQAAAPNSSPEKGAGAPVAKPAAPAGGKPAEAEPPPPRGSRQATPVEQPVLAGPLTSVEEVQAHNRAVVSTDSFTKLAASGDVNVVFDRHGAIVGVGSMRDWTKPVTDGLFNHEYHQAKLEVEDGAVKEVNVGGNDAYVKSAEPSAKLLRAALNAPNTEERKSARSAQMRREGLARKQIDVDRDSLTDAIIKLGGISDRYRLDIAGDEKMQKTIPFVGHLFTKKGDGLDEIATRLVPYGYIDAADAGDVNALSERIQDELSGIKSHYSTSMSQSALAERMAAEHPEEPEEDDQRLADEMQAAVDVPLEHNVAPEEFDEADFKANPQRLAAVDLLRQLPEDVGERLAMEHGESSDDDFIAALEKAVKEQNRGHKAEQPPSKYEPEHPEAPAGGVRKTEPGGEKPVGRQPAAGTAGETQGAGEGAVQQGRGTEVKPLFVPLAGEHYDAFAAGTKDTEYRKYGGQWTEKNVYPGRKVVLSRGYGKYARVTGTVVEATRTAPPDDTAWKEIYGDAQDAFHIKIKLDQAAPAKAPTSDLAKAWPFMSDKERRAAEQKTIERAKEQAKQPKPIDPANVPDPTNGEQLRDDPEGTLILMACCATKAAGAPGKPMPLHELYEGPLWQTLREHAGKVEISRTIVLSAKHAWASAGLMSEPYEQRLSRQRADELISRGILWQPDIPGARRNTINTSNSFFQQVQSQSQYGKRPFKNVIIVGSGDYARVFNAAVAQLDEMGYLDAQAAIVRTEGGIGTQRKQLREFLEAVNDSEREDYKELGGFKVGDRVQPARAHKGKERGEIRMLLKVGGKERARVFWPNDRTYNERGSEQHVDLTDLRHAEPDIVETAAALPKGVGPEEAHAAVRDRNEAILTPPEGTAPAAELKPQPSQQTGLFGPEELEAFVAPKKGKPPGGNPNQGELFQERAVYAAHAYDNGEVKRVAHAIREGDRAAIRHAAMEMARAVPPGAILVPMPGRSGEAGTSAILASEIAARAEDATVVRALESNAHESQYDVKKAGRPALTGEALGMRKVVGAEIPAGRPVLVVDNVVDTGETMRAALKALGIPQARALVWAVESRPVAPLESITVDVEMTVAETGKKQAVQMKADEALREIDRNIGLANQLLQCLHS